MESKGKTMLWVEFLLIILLSSRINQKIKNYDTASVAMSGFGAGATRTKETKRK